MTDPIKRALQSTMTNYIERASLVDGRAEDDPVRVAALAAPAVDPVHAAGGCYCWECGDFDSTGYEPCEDGPEFQVGHCRSFRADVQALGFCRWGYVRSNTEEVLA